MTVTTDTAPSVSDTLSSTAPITAEEPRRLPASWHLFVRHPARMARSYRFELTVAAGTVLFAAAAAGFGALAIWG